jgi:serine/threonine protein kinase
VHRDLKPENLFLARRESGVPMVKILDFGIAKVLSDTAKVSQEIKGTPLFMAYEQATGSVLSPQLRRRTYWLSEVTLSVVPDGFGSDKGRPEDELSACIYE